MRKKIVAGNWKMNKDIFETKTLLSNLQTELKDSADASVIVAPTFTNLQTAIEMTASTSITVAAQNMHQSDKGAFTGEISATMLKSIGVSTVILGHSERRAYFGETNEILASKVDTALSNDMDIIFCFGEELDDRKNNNHFSIVEKQLQEGLFHIKQEDWGKVTLAYEPVWAIGTGETATPEQAQEMHAFVRKTITSTYGVSVADEVAILYGGSVKPTNATEIFSKPDVDGGLIGGAALDAKSFAEIVASI